MEPVYRLADWTILATGWPIRILTMALGAVSSLALAPFHMFPLLWITLPVFVWILDGSIIDSTVRGWRRLAPAFVRGWWFGFGYFLGGLWWIGSAFLVEAEQFAWALPFAVLAFPAFLGIFFGLAAALARLFWVEGWVRIVSLAAAIGFTELMRGVLFTGFPWSSFGQTLATNTVLMQGISVVGVESYAIFAVLVFAAPVLLFQRGPAKSRGDRIFLSSVLVFFALLSVFGMVRISDDTADKRQFVEGVNLRIVQPAIDQKEKWLPGMADEIFGQYLDMSARATSPENFGLASTTHLIWPESAFPFLLTEKPGALSAIADLLPPGTSLITGAARAGETLPNASARTIYNSIYVINHNGEIESAYDKVHLVPFGEYLPFQPLLETIGLQQLTRIVGGFHSGRNRKPVNTLLAPAFLPLICYEIIFPHEVFLGESRENRSEIGWILNVTNDAWFGLTPGAHQHLQQAKIRAVEQGLPVVRAANTGISAVISPYGKTLARGELGQAAILDSLLPVALEETVFFQLGRIPLICFMGISFFLVWRKSSTGRQNRV